MFQWTWPVERISRRIPIDNCAIGSALDAHVTIGPDFGSDHLPQIVELGLHRD